MIIKNQGKKNTYSFRISISDQSLMSQLFPISFLSSTQSIYIERKESTENFSNGPISFRPIISKVLSKNILSSMNNNISQMLYSNTNEDQQTHS